jgi:capsular polysaccharide transport system permease protein
MQVQVLQAASSKRSPLQIQRAVLLALVIRELRSRVQGKWLGLLWMVLEPLAHVMLMLTLFGFRHNVVTINIEFPVFLVTGVLPFFMFRNLSRRLPGAVASNRSLFAYRQVKPIDAMVARAAVETSLYSAVYLAALVLLGWLGYHWLPQAPLELLAVSVLIFGFGAGLGLVFTVLSHGRPRVQALIGMLFYPLYFITGVIFPLHSLSEQVLQWLLWNPMLHLIDLSRTYFMPNYQALNGVNLAYPAACTLVVLALGISMYRVYRHRLIATG